MTQLAWAICDGCDQREPLGGNSQARISLLVAQGWGEDCAADLGLLPGVREADGI